MKRFIAILLAVLILVGNIPAMASGPVTHEECAGTLAADSEVFSVRTSSIDKAPYALDEYGFVALKSGNYEKWIDRLDLSDAPYALELYEWLADNSGRDGGGALAVPDYAYYQETGDVVVLDDGYYAHPITSFGGALTVSYTPGGSAAETQTNVMAAAEAAVLAATEGQLDTVASYASAVFYALDRDEVWNYWLSGKSMYTGRLGYSISYGGGIANVTYTHHIFFYLKTPTFDIRDSEYVCGSGSSGNNLVSNNSTGMDVTVRDYIMAGLNPDATTYDKVKHFHDWLTQNHHYDLSGGRDARYGLIAGQGIVCEGYARAFKLLCDEAGIPCVLVDGMANGEAHMWNYVKMDDGKWYAVDVTWDDPVVSGISDDVSGYEGYDYFLVGSDTVIDGKSFSLSHSVSNRPSDAAPAFTNGPVLNGTAYESADAPNFCGDNLTWVFDEATGTLTISGTGDMWDFEYNMAPWNSFCEKITDVLIEDGVTSIGQHAFSNCSSLTSVVIPDGVASIGACAFLGCTSLVSVIIPDSVTSIGNNAFTNCSSLIAAVIPDGVTSIEYSLFHNCSSLASIDIGDGVTSIGTWAFSGCSSLTSVVIPDGVTVIGSSVFSGCSDLASVDIPDSVTQIGGGTFKNCSSLTNIVIPDGVTIIEATLFSGCSSLTNVVIPDGVTIIAAAVFSDCISLPAVTIPDGVTTIGVCAFERCSSLTNVVIPDGVTNIGSSTFQDCTNLTSVDIGDGVTSIGQQAFYNCSSLASVIIPDSVTSIGHNAFENCSSLVSVKIGDSVTSVGSRAFENCSSLTEVIIPDSVTDIGNSAFSGCSSLVSADTGGGITGIASSVFKGCSSLVSVNIGDSVTSIGNYAFSDCSSLAAVVIPEGVTSIGMSAFSSTTSVYFEGNAPTVSDNFVIFDTPTDYMSFHADATLYYIPGATGWTDSEYYDADAGTWNGYKLEIWLERHDCEENGHVYDDMYDLICNACGYERPIPSVPMFRMYDPNSGEHFYTGSERERDFLVRAGWNYEGVAFNFPVIGEPVYRLYNPVSGDHLYTMDLDERAKLLDEGWNDEGVAFNSAPSDCVPQYRLWNPNAVRGAWHFTGSERERDFLINLGWQYQGIGWYSMLE